MAMLPSPGRAAAETPASASVSLADAIQRTLANQLGVQITREQVAGSRGTLQSASGAFDWNIAAYWSDEIERVPTGAVPPLLTAKRDSTDTYSVGVARLFRSGVTLTPSVTVVDYKNNYGQKEPVSTSSLAVELKVPLLRGLGARHTAASEAAARLGLRVQEFQTQFEIEQLVYQTAVAYWNCLAAARSLEIANDAEERARQIFAVVQAFANGGELDRSTLDQAKARLAMQQADRQSAELALYRSRLTLGQAMGFTAKELLAPPLAAGEFPSLLKPAELGQALNEKYASEALARRADYLAQGINVDAQEALLEQARNNLRPKLDASVKLGYTGLDGSAEKYRPARALSNDLTGVNALTTLTLDWPVPNNVARGAYLSQKAVVQQAKLNADLAAGNVAAAVLTSLETLRKYIARYELATQSAETYRRAVTQVNANLKVGEATLTELIDMEDRYQSARQTQNSALASYASTLVQLRLQTGTLTVSQDHQAVFEVKNLSTLPFSLPTP